MSDLVLGIDVGSQGTCAQLIDVQGELLAVAYEGYDVLYPRPGWAEQDPRAWLAALSRTIAEATAGVDRSRIVALSFGAQLDGLVCVDEAGEPLRDAIIWMDRRGDEVCGQIADRVDPDHLYATSGCNLDGGHVGAKIAWIREREPELFKRTARFLLPGSFVALAASGAYGVDASNASSSMLVDVRSRSWDEGLCEGFGIDPARLAPVVPPHGVLGTIAPWLREATGLPAGVLVVCGCGDEMAATLGAGVVDPGAVCDVIGTAEPICAVTSEPVFDPTRLVELHPHADPETWLLENPGFVSGGAYRWFRDHLGREELDQAGEDRVDVYELLNELAAQAPAGSEGAIWLPCLMGAMAPEWNADARAVWYGLTPAHTRAHLLRALLEGSAYALRDILGAMRASGLEPREIVCVAGGARSRLWRQIRADVTGLPVAAAADVETTARGAAMLAAAGAGAYPSVAAAAAAMARQGSAALQPDPANAAVYDEAYDRYRAVYAALRPVFTL